MSLFKQGNFQLHSGMTSQFLIDCDALTDDDLAALAAVAAKGLPTFGSVEGIPRGGLRFAAAMAPYATTGPALIADDVLTSGKSMEAQRAGRWEVQGIVIFSRTCRVPPWIRPLFQLGYGLLGYDL